MGQHGQPSHLQGRAPGAPGAPAHLHAPQEPHLALGRGITLIWLTRPRVTGVSSTFTLEPPVTRLEAIPVLAPG